MSIQAQQDNLLHRYGFTVRHVTCDGCQDHYLPQHVHRVARRLWWCDNCCWGEGRNVGVIVEPEPRRRWRDRHSGVGVFA